MSDELPTYEQLRYKRRQELGLHRLGGLYLPKPVPLLLSVEEPDHLPEIVRAAQKSRTKEKTKWT